MALAKNVNSYVDVAEADAYFSNRLDVAAWMEAPPEHREQALITATSVIDNVEWFGVAVSDTQPLMFPREGAYYSTKLARVIKFSGVPGEIIKATMEVAYHLLNNDGLLDSTGTIENLRVESISIQKITQASAIPDHIMRMLRPLTLRYLSNGGAGKLWWRAN